MPVCLLMDNNVLLPKASAIQHDAGAFYVQDRGLLIIADCPPTFAMASASPTDGTGHVPRQQLRHPKPRPCWNGHEVWATVRSPRCPGYSEPFGENGQRTGISWERGQSVRIYAIHNSSCGDYVSALTGDGSWINVWCRWNTNAQALIGCHLCRITEVASSENLQPLLKRAL